MFDIERYKMKCHQCEHWENGISLDFIYGPNQLFWTKCAQGQVVNINTTACHKFIDKKKFKRPLFRRTVGLIVVPQMKRTKIPAKNKPPRTKPAKLTSII